MQQKIKRILFPSSFSMSFRAFLLPTLSFFNDKHRHGVVTLFVQSVLEGNIILFIKLLKSEMSSLQDLMEKNGRHCYGSLRKTS